MMTRNILNLGTIIRSHRLSHIQILLRTVIGEALRTGQIEEVIEEFMPYASWAVTYPTVQLVGLDNAVL